MLICIAGFVNPIAYVGGEFPVSILGPIQEDENELPGDEDHYSSSSSVSPSSSSSADSIRHVEPDSFCCCHKCKFYNSTPSEKKNNVEKSMSVSPLSLSCHSSPSSSIYSSSEMTRLSTSSSSSSASSSPVLFTSSQSSSSQFHDSTEETGESGIVERTYGGQPARKAALVIQRAFRRYSMVKEFQRIKTERRLSRRINNNVPTTNAHSGSNGSGGTGTGGGGGGSNGCEVCVDLCHLPSPGDHHIIHHPSVDGIEGGGGGGDDEEEDVSILSGEHSRSPCPDVTEVEIEIDQQHLPLHLRTNTSTTNCKSQPLPLPTSNHSSLYPQHQHYNNHYNPRHNNSSPSEQSQTQQQQLVSSASRKQLINGTDSRDSSTTITSPLSAQNSSSSSRLQYEQKSNGSPPTHNAQYEPCSRYIPTTNNTPNQQPPPSRHYVDYQYQHPYTLNHHHPQQMMYNNQMHTCNNGSVNQNNVTVSMNNSLQQQQSTKSLNKSSPNNSNSPNGVILQQSSQLHHSHHQCPAGINNGVVRGGVVQHQNSVPPQVVLPINNSNYRLPMTDVECEILRKRLYRVGLNLFNKKPEVGISYLVKKKFIEGTAGAVSRFLISRKGLSKQMIGEYLANLQNPFCQSCLEHFSSEIDLSKMPIDLALRRFQTFLRMPGEAQKIERIMETFSQRYGVCNPQVTSQFRNGADTVFVLAFAIIMLNTDLHTPHLKADRRMKMEDFIKNLRGIDDGGDIPREMLVEIYDRIKSNEFRTGSDHVTQVMKVQQTIVGKKPNMALPHRRLVCYCRLYEVADTNKREKVGSHQREVFLFNDILVLTKIFHKKRNSVTYSFRQSYPLMGISLVLFTNQYYEFGLSLRRGDTVLLNLNARNEHDRAKFAEDLREAIAESDEMGRMESLSKENRDSGVDVGKIKRFSNSLLDINDQCKPTRRGSCGSLDSGMSISFHSDENQQSQQSQQSSNNNSSRSSSSICHKHQNSSCSNSSTSTTQSK